MSLPYLISATVLTLLAGSTLGSCNKDDARSSQVASSLEPEEQSSSQAMMQQVRAGCPMVVQGAEVAVSDTENGVALTFTTGTDDVADLGTRVRSMAKMYEMHGVMTWHQMGGEGMGHGMGMGLTPGMGVAPGMGLAPGMGNGMEHTAGIGPMPAASSTVTDTDKGARIELRPTDKSELDALRQHVRSHQQRMHSGECWMIQEQSPTQGGQD